MSAAHGFFMLLTVGSVLLLTAAAKLTRPGSRSEKWVVRLIVSALFLALSGEMGGPGLNGANLLWTAGLGLPGYALTAALKLL